MDATTYTSTQTTKAISLKNRRVLLPSGFRDLLPTEAHKEENAVRQFLDTCRAYGYERVRPPLAEFEEALFMEGPGLSVKEQAFRFVDPVSQKMMALRFDITTQIARIAATRFKASKKPLRLMYANDVLRAKATQRRADRQFQQVGCELVSAPNAQADLEAAVLSLQALHAMGIDTVTIDLSYAKLLHLILDAYDIQGADKEQWLDMLERKDMAALKARPEGFSRALVDVVEACGDPATTIEALSGLKENTHIQGCVEELSVLAQGIQDAAQDLGYSGVTVTIDPFEVRGFKYHTGICFALFTPKVGSEIGRGGRYDILGGFSACGFTLYIDMVLPVVPEVPVAKRIAVDADTPWTQIKALQEKGWTTERIVAEEDSATGVTHIYKEGQILPLEDKR